MNKVNTLVLIVSRTVAGFPNLLLRNYSILDRTHTQYQRSNVNGALTLPLPATIQERRMEYMAPGGGFLMEAAG